MLHRVSTRLWMSAGLAASLALGGTASADFIYTLNNTPGLISHWSLNETTGNTVYDSVTDDAVDGANNGTFVIEGGASLGVPGPSGIGFAPSNKAMNFSGTTTQALTMTADPDFANLTAVSLGMWFRITNSAPHHHYLGGYANTTASDRYGFVLNHYPDDNDSDSVPEGLRAFMRVGNPPNITSANTDNDAGGVYLDSTWHYALMTVGNEGGNKVTRLYVDGAFKAAKGAAGAGAWDISVRDVLTFGLDLGDTSRKMVGDIDEISIFNRALTANEVSALYASAFQPLQVPEPSTICMVLAAAAGALVWRRRMA